MVALKKTCTACPSQWESILEDGRVIYARYRHGALRVGIGSDINDAVHNGWTDDAHYIGDGFDGFMDFEELKVHLHGQLDFPADLVVENE